MGVNLTKGSRQTLKRIYDIYRKRRKGGQSKDDAVCFVPPEFGGQKIDGLEDSCGELEKANFLRVDIVGGFELTDEAIIFMENFKKDAILKWVEAGANLIP